MYVNSLVLSTLCLKHKCAEFAFLCVEFDAELQRLVALEKRIEHWNRLFVQNADPALPKVGHLDK